jgi:hypothetical protein
LAEKIKPASAGLLGEGRIWPRGEQTIGCGDSAAEETSSMGSAYEKDLRIG